MPLRHACWPVLLRCSLIPSLCVCDGFSVVEDMQKEYMAYIDYVLPNAVSLLTKFRELRLPVVWTNWSRVIGDGLYGGIDRFYGPRGIGPKANPCYLHEDGGNETYGGQLHLSRIDLAPPHAAARIGSFPPNELVQNDAGAFAFAPPSAGGAGGGPAAAPPPWEWYHSRVI